MAAGDPDSHPQAMKKPRRPAASAAWCCRVVARSLMRGASTNVNAGSVGDNGGALAVKAGSVCSNAAMDSTGVASRILNS
jgi:hypothetical protein